METLGSSMFRNIAAMAISPPLTSKRQDRKPTIPRTPSGTIFSKFHKRRTISITQMAIANQGADPPLMAAPSTHKKASGEFKSASGPQTRQWFVFVHTQNRGLSNYISSSSVSTRTTQSNLRIFPFQKHLHRRVSRTPMSGYVTAQARFLHILIYFWKIPSYMSPELMRTTPNRIFGPWAVWFTNSALSNLHSTKPRHISNWAFLFGTFAFTSLSSSLFICQIGMNAYHCSLEDTPRPLHQSSNLCWTSTWVLPDFPPIYH